MNIIKKIQLFTCLLFCASVLPAQGAQEYRGLCSFIRINIQQELSLERVGFLATLEVTNNEGDAVITNFAAALTFTEIDKDGKSIDVSDRFFVQPAQLSGVNSISGAGLINPGQTATVSWFIIPKTDAGGKSPAGTLYKVGAELAGSLYGTQIDPSVLAVIPDKITVKPEPKLDIIYFQPRDVDGDNPFTLNVVEAPIPFTLGVLVNNHGYGQANKLKIQSQQPKVVQDLENLLVVPQLIGSRVNDEPVDNASLTVNIGNISPGSCRKAAWDMITTLSGEFTEFKASYTHASELGGESTSLINSINAYFMVHEVLNDQVGRDGLLDFLATTDSKQQDLIPDTLYETDCNSLPVNRLTNVTVGSYNGQVATIKATADFNDWVFMRLNDPAQDKFPIASVVRSDGKVLNKHNYWTNTRFDKITKNPLNYLNIFDNVALGEYTYTVNYATVGGDDIAPVTTLLFSGKYEVSGDTTYILPETELFFVVKDNSPVSISYRADAGKFKPAYPFSLASGSHTIEYFSEDSFKNAEAVKTQKIVVVGAFPVIGDFTSNVENLLIAGDSLSVRPTQVDLSFMGQTGAPTLGGSLEVFQGVFAAPTLRGLPASPTKNSTAKLTVAGENVDFYRYKLGSAAWSNERAVVQPLELNGLTGAVALSVQGRSKYGVFPATDEDNLSVSWVVNPDAYPTTVVLNADTPSRDVNVSLQVAGADVYRWTIDANFFRAETPVINRIDLNSLSQTTHIIDVVGRNNGAEWQPLTQPSKVRLVVDRNYGLRFPANTKVYQRTLGALDKDTTRFNWNGLSNTGAAVTPGWYTVKTTIADGLGQTTSAVKLVQVGNLLPTNQLLATADSSRQTNANGSERWAVWQDQRNGTWNIFARDVFNSSAVEFAVTNLTLNQELPRTDGKYVVWQARQADGNWDIWVKNLTSSEPAFAVTQSIASDDIHPVIEWPWVVYQSKPLNNPTAPWQLYAKNLITNTVQAVDASTQDQLDPSISKQQIVWQDFRDVGAGEIYLQNLTSKKTTRITQNTGGQYHPKIKNQWIVWEDNRNTQIDLYAYNLLRGVEIQLTNTPEDETHPDINDQWVVYEEDLAGEQKINLRMLLLSNKASVQLTNATSPKQKPFLVSGHVVWTDQPNGYPQALIAKLPDLQPVFNNRNMVVVTQGLVDHMPQASALLRLWQKEAGVVELVRYRQLVPELNVQTLTWDNGSMTGEDFSLAVGDFIWVKFNDAHILDFADSLCKPIDFSIGINTLSSACFPDNYSAYQLLKSVGIARVNALRTLNADTGRWQVATVVNGRIVGEDFKIPRATVVLLNMTQSLNQWQP